METNPSDPSGGAGSPFAPSALWNPNAAANWTLIFSPVFGAYLHYLNWIALNEPERARAAKTWFYASLAVMAASILAPAAAARGLSLLFLVTWYFKSARRQAEFVKEKYGDAYPRRGWTKPLLIGLGAIVGLIIVSAVVGAAQAILTGTPPDAG